MFRNYFKIAIRNLLKNKAFSAINIIGLSVSMAVCLLIMLIIADQYSFDNYNKNKDRVYRIISNTKSQEGIITPFAPAPLPLVERLKQESSAVEKVAVIHRFDANISTQDKALKINGFHANADFLDVFDKKLIAGNSATALAEPNSIVLTAATAEKLFQQENPIGKILTLENEEGKAIGNLTVTGVLQDKEERSHLNYESLVSFATFQAEAQSGNYGGMGLEEWLNVYEFWVYVLTKPNTNITSLQNILNQIAQTECQKPDIFPHITFETEALRRINPATKDLGNQVQPVLPAWIITFLAGLALVVLLLACFNYASLSLARSLKRAKEVGIRKVAGAFRGQIVGQFLTESVVLSLLALGGALAFLQFLIPAFYSLDPEISKLFTLKTGNTIYVWFVVFAITIGLLAGLSPALLLSRFKPVETLRKLANVKVFSYLNIRKGLVVMQFAVSLIFIITTLVISRQFQHTMKADLGFNTENIINVKLQNQSYSLYQQAISTYKDVNVVSASSIIPATNNLSGTMARKVNNADSIYLAYLSVDPNFITNLDLKLLAGRNFTAVDSLNTEKFIILNEKAVEDFKLESPQAAVGQFITLEGKNLEVIGVIKDFVVFNPNQPRQATALRSFANFFTFVNVRVSGFETAATLQALEAAWKTLGTKRPFEYQFYDELRAQAFLELILMMRVVGFAGVLAILIACMGLLGMVLYTTEARLKEVSIRKVLGADVASLVFLLSKGFLKLMVIAIAIGAPAAYLLNNMWLQNYAYRIQIDFSILIVSVLALIGLAFLTIGSQVFKAALTNPVDNLSNE